MKNRLPNGHFVKGHPGGPGNPFASRVTAYRRALMDAVSTDDVQAVARSLVLMAKSGDVAAAKLILERTAGKPIEVDDDAGDRIADAARVFRQFVEQAMDASKGDPNAVIGGQQGDSREDGDG